MVRAASEAPHELSSPESTFPAGVTANDRVNALISVGRNLIDGRFDSRKRRSATGSGGELPYPLCNVLSNTPDVSDTAISANGPSATRASVDRGFGPCSYHKPFFEDFAFYVFLPRCSSFT